jgi:hypothetical protein
MAYSNVTGRVYLQTRMMGPSPATHAIAYSEDDGENWVVSQVQMRESPVCFVMQVGSSAIFTFSLWPTEYM